MRKPEKERIVEQLTERLQTSQALLVTDFRGLTMTQIDSLRGELLSHGAKFQVVKNTLTRRAAEAAGADAVLALLEGPSAIAFLDAEGDPVAVAKALADAARATRILTLRGGILEGRAIEAADVEELATLPPVDILRGQVLGAVTAPLMTILALFTAPLQDLYGLIDARIEQLEAQGDTSHAAAEADAQTGEAQAEATEAEEQANPSEADASASDSAEEEEQ